MADIILEVLSRDAKKEKNRNLRKNGNVPAVIYGHSKETKTIKFSKIDFSKKIQANLASNLFIDLQIDGEKKPSKTVFIKEIQKDCISREIEHIDFIEINPNEKIHISVPVVLKGDSVGVTAGGGFLEFSLRSIEVECLPKDTPKIISIDISDLAMGHSIHVKDLNLGENIRILTSSDSSIASVTAKRTEVEAEKAVAAAPAAGAAAPGAAPAAAAGAAPADAKAKKGKA